MLKLARLARNIASRDPGRRVTALKIIADWLIPDFRLTWPQLVWRNDPGFNAYLDRYGERGGMNTHRHWMVGQLVRLISGVPGDTAECGVYMGAASSRICAAGRTHHLFDSFEGLSLPGPFDGGHWKGGDLRGPEDQVRANLEPFLDQLVFHKGWIPDRFADVDRTRFAFVHIDVDLDQPTLDSIAFFYPRIAAGGILLCDDYGMTTCPGATRAVDEFLGDKPEKMILLDAGGGFMIKGTPVLDGLEQVRLPVRPSPQQ
jgi:hypothetical protein